MELSRSDTRPGWEKKDHEARAGKDWLSRLDASIISQQPIRCALRAAYRARAYSGGGGEKGWGRERSESADHYSAQSG
jgi:hypothetical protein